MDYTAHEVGPQAAYIAGGWFLAPPSWASIAGWQLTSSRRCGCTFYTVGGLDLDGLPVSRVVMRLCTSCGLPSRRQGRLL